MRSDKNISYFIAAQNRVMASLVSMIRVNLKDFLIVLVERERERSHFRVIVSKMSKRCDVARFYHFRYPLSFVFVA